MASNLIIRRALPEESALVQSIEEDAGKLFLEVGLDEVANAPPHELAFLEDVATKGLLWVAHDDRAGLVGMAAVEELSSWPYLLELSVRPTHGRRGIGAALVRELAGCMRAAGHRELILSTFADIPWNAPYYRRLGFELVPSTHWSPEMRRIRSSEAEDGLEIDQRVIMRLPLQD
jgi:GNAT superfamily N-acetyltransferase